MDFYDSLYIRTDNFKNFHPFSPFPEPVDLHFRPKMARTGQKSIIFTKNGGSRSIIWIRNDLNRLLWHFVHPYRNFNNFLSICTIHWTHRPSIRAQKGPKEARNQLFSQQMAAQGQ